MSETGVRKPSLWVWLAAISALMSSMTMGCILGWTAPAFPSMKEADSTPQLTKENADMETWIGSSMTLGALIGGLIVGPLIGMLGMKKTLIGLGVPFILGWILICVAKTFWLIIIGRVMGGFAAGICCGVAPTYCNHISTPNIRGLLGTGFQIMVTVGILYIDVFGIWIGWRYLCIIGLLPAAFMTVGMLFMPESPTFLINKFGRSSQVVDVMRKLRSEDSDIELELKELQDRADKSAKEDSGFSMSQVMRRDFYMPFIIANLLMFFQQFSGINAVLFYSSSIFEDSGSSMDPKISTCVVSAAMVAATITGGLIIDKLGRKMLLLVSGGGHVISLGVMGYYYFQKRNDNKPIATTLADLTTEATTLASGLTTIGTTISSTINSTIGSTTAPSSSSDLGWLPVVCLVVFVISFSLGYGPIPWMIVAEITPGFAIGIVSSIATAFNWFCAFLVTKEFAAIQEGIQAYGTFWLFAGISAAGFIFVLIFVPETKGKSLDQMQKIFLGTNIDTIEKENNKYNINKNVSTV